MNIVDSVRNTSTAGYIGATTAAFLGAFAIRALVRLVPYSMDSTKQALELLAIGLFFIAYLGSWALIPIGAFRPTNRFTLQGGRNRRIGNVLLAVILVVAIHVAVGLGLAAARS